MSAHEARCIFCVKHTFLLLQCSFLPKFSIHIETKYEDNKGSNDSVSMIPCAKLDFILFVNHSLCLGPLGLSVWEKRPHQTCACAPPWLFWSWAAAEELPLKHQEMKDLCTQLPFYLSYSICSFSKHNIIYICEFSPDKHIWKVKKRWLSLFFGVIVFHFMCFTLLSLNKGGWIPRRCQEEQTGNWTMVRDERSQ